ncbi:MAG: NAD(P)-dependent oxidoreductase [Deltaproteobacteria bacterium]|nr:NAD(P)-dependent oxidoreductase [Deltaproteobacteria bacterium]
MASCLIIGGSGYIGTHLAKHLLSHNKFSHIYIADLKPSSLQGNPSITFFQLDVRQPIPKDLLPENPEWIFNLAAICREPGYEAHEYFETNLAGARHVCDYAEVIECNNIFFTSSMAIYGPTKGATEETAVPCPATPYGASKLAAEFIHEGWKRGKIGRRLLIVRPGVIYGPGDVGNILRMIRAIQKGYFAIPGSASVYKSYGYIYGLLESFTFMMEKKTDFAKYNYVEYPCEPIGYIVKKTKKFLGSSAPVLTVPMWVLVPLSHIVQCILGSKNPIHPVRVKKVGTSTHLVPKVLLDTGFRFNYNYLGSLEHWSRIAPEDFKLKT